MIVKCVENNIDKMEINSSLLAMMKSHWIGGSEGVLHLKKNKYYVVLGITYKNGYPMYFVCDERFSYYPMAYVFSAFDVYDSRISKYWRYAVSLNEKTKSIYSRLVFPQWADDDFYYDRLVDNNKEDVDLFLAYKEKMILEFRLPYIDEHVKIIERKWVMCPKCDEAWEESSHNEMTRCPECNIFLILK
ncbi:MAG: hypothetical protein D3910_20125 [Candidatus Electrothrix sp. ATG2]|nr:hypothetical protein [Candidatus Electrothrix sp. ATG2]